MPEPLIRLAARDNFGRQLRHDHREVVTAIDEAISPDSVGSGSLNIVKERIGRASDKDAITLPPNNFHLSGAERISRVFMEMRNNARTWGDRFAEIEVRRFTKSDLPDMPGQSVRHTLVDVRGVAFFSAHETAQHGNLYDIDQQSSVKDIVNLLQSMYRFGAPIAHGMHYDTQNADASPFRKRVFDCSKSGPVSVSNCHANVYLNDYIRATNKQKI